MAKSRIQRLDVEGFRGVFQHRSLLFKGKSFLLFGGNGSGKSTFVDALEKLFTGRVSTLDGRAQGLSSQRQGPHIKLVSGAPGISVTFDRGATLDLTTDLASLPESLRTYLEAARQPVYILRRGQILGFIESLPRDRYQLLRPYLPLSGAEAIEQTFTTVKEHTEEDVERCRSKMSMRQGDLSQLLDLKRGRDDLSEEDILRVLADRLKTIGYQPLTQLDEIPKTVDQLNVELSGFGDLSKPTALTGVVGALEELSNAATALNSELLATSVARLRQQEASTTKVFYERVLEEGARWIEEERRIECPLCEQEMRRFPPDEVVRRTGERLEQMKELLALRRVANKNLGLLRDAVRSCTEAAKRAMVKFSQITREERADGEETIQSATTLLENISHLLGRPVAEIDVDGLHSSITPFRPSGRMAQRLAQDIAFFQKELGSLPSTQAAQNLLEVRELLKRVKSSWDELVLFRNASARAQKLATVAGIAHATLQDARKEAISDLFAEISEDLDQIYRELHKHHETNGKSKASHRNIRLEIREAVQGSVNLRGDFYDRSSEDPRAYYSDAHLDTLGISIFLALRRWYRRQHPEFDLMVMDDVMTSVDSGHAVRLAEVLLKDFSDFQILLTTHDRIWFEHLRDIQTRCRVAQNFVNKTIYKWTIEEGPDLREPEDEHRQLEKLLEDGESYQIASVAGRLLEHILQEMRYALRLPVPAKPGEIYEIGDLWPAFYKEVRKNFSGLYMEGRQTFDAIDVSWPLRNWIGAHFNLWAGNVSQKVAQEFGHAVAKLFDLLFCNECRRFVAPSATPLGQIACRCGDRIYPAPGKQAVPVSSREDMVAKTDGVLRGAKLNSELHLEWKRAERERKH